MLWHELKNGDSNEREGSLLSLTNLRTESTPEHTRVRIQGRLNSGMICVSKVTAARAGNALLLLVDGTLPFLAGRHRTSSFDATFDIPEGVTEIRLSTKNGDVLWRRDDCLKQFQDGGGVWHCDDKT